MTKREKIRAQLLYWPGAHRLQRLGYADVDAAVDAVLSGHAPWFNL